MYNFNFLIDGEVVTSSNNARIDVLCPVTNEVVGTVAKGTEKDAHKALVAADKAKDAWADLPVSERARYVNELADICLTHKEELAQILSLEHGKIISEARGEVDGTIRFFRYAAENAYRVEGEVIPSDFYHETGIIERVPFGVTVGLLAWNFPLALAGRKVGNALATGNTMVIKPPTETPLTVMYFGELIAKSNLPKGVLNFVAGPGSTVGNTLVSDPLTKLVTLTGSTGAGRQLCKAAAENITVLHLELGGKAPFMVMDDANIDKAVDAAVVSKFSNCGQICTCNERMYIHEKVYDEFKEKFIAKCKKLTVGDSFDETASMGPKVNVPEVEKLDKLLSQSLKEGGKLIYDGETEAYVADLKKKYPRGNWYFPKVVEVTDNKNILMHEEVFGPIIPMMKISSFDEALTYANDCDYGLSSYIFTNNFKNIMTITRKLDFGEVYVNREHGELINGFHNGFNLSGVGGEDGKHGLMSYLQKKAVYLNYNI